MLTIRSLALLAAATVVAGQTIESLGSCALDCYNNVKAQAGTWECAADEMACLCAVGDFKNGIHDCSKACEGGEAFAGSVIAAVNALCATAAPAAPTPEPTVTAPVKPEETEGPPDGFETAPAPTATPSDILATVGTSTPSTTLETSTTPTATGAPATSTSSDDAAAAKPTASTTASTTTSSTSETESTSSPQSTESSEPAGLTVGAKAGIGIGAGAAVIALLGVAGWFFMRQQRNKRANGFSSKHMIKISDPAPGGGRSFAGDHHYETGLSELEMKSRRYEDMVPRQQPRHMV